MSPKSWVKRKFVLLKSHKAKGWQLHRPGSASASNLEMPLVPEMVIAADFRCCKCRKKTCQLISEVDDVESMMVHLLDNKVTLTRKPVHKGSLRKVSAFCRKISRKASRIT